MCRLYAEAGPNEELRVVYAHSLMWHSHASFGRTPGGDAAGVGSDFQRMMWTAPLSQLPCCDPVST